jgi:transcriptional regulator with GAF, ATPase, and Fis domain
MSDPAAAVLEAFGGRFVLRERYAGGEGVALRVAGPDGADAVLKVLPVGEQPQEAALLVSLRHPAIPAVLEVGRLPDGRAFVLREFVAGTPLVRLPGDPEALRADLRQLLAVLAYVHLRAVLHLDLKPANLVRDGLGHLHLLDFGLGGRRGSHGRGGTPFYAAPEVLLGAVPDPRADLFAVGAMVVAALWPGERLPVARFVAMFPQHDFWTALGAGVETFPEPFRRFLQRCVARDLGQRFADAQEALEALGGGSGRPVLALLTPDPVALHAEVITAALAAAPTADLEFTGGGAADRRAVALHVAGRTAARGLGETPAAVRVDRGGAQVVRLPLPQLAAGPLAQHLASVCELEPLAAAAAAHWLLVQGAGTSEAVGAQLAAAVQDGAIVPAGSRWSWPAAAAGRLAVTDAPLPLDTAATPPERLQALAARGQREAAVAAWRRSVAAGGDEPALRAALARGLLDAGEPTAALVFVADLPWLEAEALLDLGRIEAAGAVLARAAAMDLPEPAAARVRALRGRHLLLRGDRRAALALLDTAAATPGERVVRAAVLAELGEVPTAQQQLRELLAAAADQPFLAASIRTELGHLCRRSGDALGAQAEFAVAAELLFGAGHVRHAAKARQNLGVVAKDRGEHELAVAHLRAARALFAHAGDEVGAETCAANLGIAALAAGDAAGAVGWLAAAAPRLLELGDRTAGRLAQAMLAKAQAELGDAAAAAATLAALGTPDTVRLAAEVADAEARLRRHAAPAVLVPPAATTAPAMSPPSGPSRELFRTFLAVNRQLAQETDLDRALRHLLDAAVTLTGGRQGYLLVVRESGLQREFQSGDPGPAAQAFSRSLAHRAMALQRTLTGAEALADRELQELPSVRNLAVRSAVCAPFRSAGGIAGAIYVEHAGRAGVFQDPDKEALEVLADQAAIAVDRLLREQALAQELEASRRELVLAGRTRRRPSALLGDSAPMQDLKAQIDRLAALDLPVLVLGETGTGKELVARALHEQGPRRRGPFVAENCSALPGELMERELFGHVQGAFTGADRERPGLLELANGGTLLLDEVGDMPASLQAKLLRALQERSIRRVGGSEAIALDLRLVAATHKDLRAMVQRGEFREDLFYRLAAVELRVPPLRARGADQMLLAEHFLGQHAERVGRPLRLGAVARAAIEAYPWPGNVRELDHVLARAALLADGDELVDLQLPAALPAMAGAAAGGATEVVTLKEAERRALLAALQACGGDKAKAARRLEISRTALYEKIKRHGLA